MRSKIEIIKGDTFEGEVSVVNKAGEPVSLVGATVVWRIASEAAPVTDILNKTDTDPAFVFTDRAGGKFSLRLEEAETEALVAGEYFHTIRIRFANGTRKTVVRENIVVSSDF